MSHRAGGASAGGKFAPHVGQTQILSSGPVTVSIGITSPYSQAVSPSPSDPPPSRWRSYRDVDAARDASGLATYMERLAAIAAIAAEKERSLGLLGLTAGRACLDVGCGTGPELERLLERVAPGGRVVGLDRSAGLLAEAERRSRAGDSAARAPASLELVVGDAQAIPFGDGEFDACRADRALQHVDCPQRALAEMVRVTRPGGRVVVTELRWGLVAPELDRTMTDAILGALAAGGERDAWLGHRLTELFAGAGLTEIQSVSHSHAVESAEELAGLLDLDWALPAVSGGGAVSGERAARWRESLLELAGRGDAFAGMVVLHVAGVRPADPAA